MTHETALTSTYEPQHEISNNVAFGMSLCSLILSLETQNAVRSVA